ncbi:MAG: AhpC/TSA family protein [Saprospiraceae bacterium]|nr:AhpC/TSA family protein [Saprospiraceae bacterium]MBK8370299.1 AhpC/TSA family protein [Saprospiraceae bacterium]MBK8546689.1 AhpC/TSA family protein [Saprospiraceae bacterium]MBK8817812.1 AhpC/TSA family protein [Saprospiraceae bacterium]MBK8854756.1 AhpC/TSA family protein [Saprospiraceae bacterium]
MVKNIFFLVFSILMVSACAANKGTSISGKIEGASKMSVYLDKMKGGNNSEILLTAETGQDGTFEFKIPEGLKKGIYRLRIGAQLVDILSNGSEKKVVVNGSLSQLNNFEYTVTGSPLTEEYTQKVQDYINKKMDVPSLQKYTGETADPMIGYQIANRLFTVRPEFIDLHNKVSSRYLTAYPEQETAQFYQQVVGQLAQSIKMQSAAAKIQVGQPAPEISLPGPDGKVRKLSSYKGKVVLIDFWASWCGPCRKANPMVVDIYNRYKSKGFDVFSVSLDGVDSRTSAQIQDQQQLNQIIDQQKTRWLAAIQQDQLTWDGHVSDLKKWECAPAQEYGVRSIPQTFLVGRDGKIVALNPKFDLEEQVKKYL